MEKPILVVIPPPSAMWLLLTDYEVFRGLFLCGSINITCNWIICHIGHKRKLFLDNHTKQAGLGHNKRFPLIRPGILLNPSASKNSGGKSYHKNSVCSDHQKGFSDNMSISLQS